MLYRHISKFQKRTLIQYLGVLCFGEVNFGTISPTFYWGNVWQIESFKMDTKMEAAHCLNLVNSLVSILEYWANHHGTHTQNRIFNKKNLTILKISVEWRNSFNNGLLKGRKNNFCKKKILPENGENSFRIWRSGNTGQSKDR